MSGSGYKDTPGPILMDAILSEISRVKDILNRYEKTPRRPGKFLGTYYIKLSIADAEQAIAQGDAQKILMAYRALMEW